jgi:acyl-CoA thioesterase
MTATPFARDTAVSPLGDGRFAATCSDRYNAPRGPNGGYLAAIILRALIAHAEEPGAPVRHPRSLTLHYLRPPAAGGVEVAVTVERTGRRLTTLSARLEQDGRLCVMAVAALATDFGAVADYADPMPSVEPPDELFQPPDAPAVPPIARRFRMRPAIGPRVLSGADEALTGGWIAFAEGPQPLDAPALAMLTDAWLPAPFTRLREPVGAPTVDLTIHFRSPDVIAAEPVLASFRSRFSHGGFFEEDGELWSADGVLLAQSRQLALLVR